MGDPEAEAGSFLDSCMSDLPCCAAVYLSEKLVVSNCRVGCGCVHLGTSVAQAKQLSNKWTQLSAHNWQTHPSAQVFFLFCDMCWLTNYLYSSNQTWEYDQLLFMHNVA